jgi:transcriptional regulator with XRE-family HTH domain
MGERTAQLLKTLRAFCEEERGRQTKVARILGVGPSVVAEWFSGRRRMTGEQSLAVQDFLRTVYGPEKPPETPTQPLPDEDSLQHLHAHLEDRSKKNVWIRTIGEFHHIILGGPTRDKALARIVAFLKQGK